MEKLSSTKQVPGASEVGDRCLRGQWGDRGPRHGSSVTTPLHQLETSVSFSQLVSEEQRKETRHEAVELLAQGHPMRGLWETGSEDQAVCFCVCFCVCDYLPPTPGDKQLPFLLLILIFFELEMAFLSHSLSTLH